MNPLPGLSQLRLRPLLVISELLLIAALAFVASQRQLALVFLIPVGIGLVLTFLRWPPSDYSSPLWPGWSFLSPDPAA